MSDKATINQEFQIETPQLLVEYLQQADLELGDTLTTITNVGPEIIDSLNSLGNNYMYEVNKILASKITKGLEQGKYLEISLFVEGVSTGGIHRLFAEPIIYQVIAAEVNANIEESVDENQEKSIKPLFNHLANLIGKEYSDEMYEEYLMLVRNISLEPDAIEPNINRVTQKFLSLITSINFLESRKKGSARDIYKKFGVRNFEKYQDLLDQLEQYPGCIAQSNSIQFDTTGDHNMVTRKGDPGNISKAEVIKSDYFGGETEKRVVLGVTSFKEFVRQLQLIADIKSKHYKETGVYIPVEMVYFSTHGGPNSITLSPKNRLTVDNLEQLYLLGDLLNSLQAIFEDHTVIVLDACSTGKTGTGFAAKLSKVFRTSVIAHQHSIFGGLKLKEQQNTDLLSVEGRVDMAGTYTGATHFYNGTLVKESELKPFNRNAINSILQ